MKKALLLAMLVTGCTAIGGDQDTYQRLLAKLCAAPPNIMQNVLSTPELQRAWAAICARRDTVPPIPVQAQIAEPVQLH